MKPVRLDDEAQAEIDAAVSWYDVNAETVVVGDQFLAEIEQALERIAENPAAFSLTTGVPAELGARRCLLHRFPFAVVFLELPQEIRVVALAHHRRRPGYWRPRL